MLNYKNIEFKEMHENVDFILDVGFYYNTNWCKVSGVNYMDGDDVWCSFTNRKLIKFYYYQYHRNGSIISKLSSELQSICICYDIDLNNIAPYIGSIYVNHNYKSYFELCLNEAIKRFINV